MTKQEAYEAIRAYFTRPDAVLAKSADGEGMSRCWYRQDQDVNSPVRCGVGCLIPDELYQPFFDEGVIGGGMSVSGLFGHTDLREHLGDGNMLFLASVQSHHDDITTETTEEFVAKLDGLAEQYGLSVAS